MKINNKICQQLKLESLRTTIILSFLIILRVLYLISIS